MGDRGARNLPPGFRFFPTDEELVVHFLYHKAAHLPCHPDIIPSLDLCGYDPWELNGEALAGGNGWYFFSRRTQTRVSPNGYWRAIAADEPVTSCNKTVGIKKFLAFFIGEAPQGIKTNWMMNEYHLLDSSVCCSTGTSDSNTGSRRSSKKRGQPKQDSNKWVLCRVFESSCGLQTSFYDDGTELSCLDEVFLSLDDDLDDISLPD